MINTTDCSVCDCFELWKLLEWKNECGHMLIERPGGKWTIQGPSGTIVSYHTGLLESLRLAKQRWDEAEEHLKKLNERNKDVS